VLDAVLGITFLFTLVLLLSEDTADDEIDLCEILVLRFLLLSAELLSSSDGLSEELPVDFGTNDWLASLSSASCSLSSL
jgi:hypothetical protein